MAIEDAEEGNVGFWVLLSWDGGRRRQGQWGGRRGAKWGGGETNESTGKLQINKSFTMAASGKKDAYIQVCRHRHPSATILRPLEPRCAPSGPSLVEWWACP